MAKVKNMIGKQFGKLTVIAEAGRDKRRETLWECLCSCGNKTVVLGGNLRQGKVHSCGCAIAENKPNLIHGLSRSPLYNVWNSMKSRCYNPSVKSYPNYGGRGITVCEEWRHDFQAFYNWAMSHGYKRPFY